MGRLMPLLPEEDARPAGYRGRHRNPSLLHRALDATLTAAAALGEALHAYALLAEDIKDPDPPVGEVWMLAYWQWPHGMGYLEHLGGIGWSDAPVPHRWHRCRPQTRGWMQCFVERCACGATRLDQSHWMQRNQRRRDPGSGAATGTPAPDPADTTYGSTQ